MYVHTVCEFFNIYYSFQHQEYNNQFIHTLMELKCIPEANKQYYLDNIFFFLHVLTEPRKHSFSTKERFALMSKGSSQFY